MISKTKIRNRRRLKHHIRLHLAGSPARPRLTVYRSLKHIYAQIIDDSSGKTLVSASDVLKGQSFAGGKGQMVIAKQVGSLVAKLAGEKSITQVVFDRNGYLYHGVVKALADGAREGGLKF